MYKSCFIGTFASLVICSCYASPVSKPVAEIFSGEADWAASPGWESGSNAAPAFTSDGKTIFFTHWHDDTSTIMTSHSEHSHWSKPEPAPFSGHWRDLEAAMSPDGTYLIFISNRPAVEGGKAINGFFQGQVQPEQGGNLWRVDKASGWSRPVRLPNEVNNNTAIYSPSVARSGNLYFNQSDPKTKKERLSWSRIVNGHYTTPEPISFDDGTTSNFTAAVDPDESFIIFSGHRPPSPEHKAVVFVAFSKHGKWETPVPFTPYLLGEQARLSPDLKVLYFTTNQPYLEVAPNPTAKAPYRIWQVSLDGWEVLGKPD